MAINKRKYKKKYRGTRYVANVLKKYFPKKFRTYTAALPKAREISEQLKQSRQRFTVKNVSSFIREKRVPVSEKIAPKISENMLVPRPYYDLSDYDTYIYLSSNEVLFKSDLYNKPSLEFKGGQRPNYSETFSGFVNFSNRETPPSTTSAEIKIFVITTPPKKENGQWVSYILSVDPNGEPYDFGYKPVQPSPEEQAKKREKRPKVEPEKESKKSTPSDRASELIAETNKNKSEILKMGLEQYSKGKLTKKEYLELVNIVKSM